MLWGAFMLIPIIIVTHNNSDNIILCLESLFKTTLHGDEIEIILVDNASTDGTREILKEFLVKAPRIKLKVLFLRRNVGFAAAVNIGLKHASPSPYFVLLNPDTIVTPSWLSELINAVKRSKGEIVMAQSLLLNFDGRIDCAGGFLNFWGYPVELWKGKFLDKYPLSILPYPVGYAKGAAVLIDSKAYLNSGGLDEKFFFYYEEVDLAYRMRRRGQVVVVPSSIVYHRGTGSKVPKKDLFILYHMERNRLYFLYKNEPSKLLLALIQALIGALKDRGIRRKVRLKAITDFFKLILTGHTEGFKTLKI